MINNKTAAMFLAATLVVFTVGCSSVQNSKGISQDASPPEMSYEEGAASPESPAERDYDKGVGDEFTQSENKVIYEHFLQLESKSFEETKMDMEELVKSAKGYIQHSSTSRNNHYGDQTYRTSHYIFRVPSEKAGDTVKGLSETGHLVEESSGSKDVTYQHQDIDSRIKSLESQENRLNQLYERADKIEDVIVLEERISNVIREKESLKNQLKTLDNRISYSLIDVKVTEVVDITVIEDVRTTFGERAKNALTGSFRQFGNGAQNMAISVIYTLPWLIFFLIIGTGGFVLYNKWNKKD